MSTVKATDLLAITRPSGGDAGTYKVAVSDLPHAVPATETAQGVVELATAAETTTGTDNTRAVHPAGLKAALDAQKLWDRTGTVISPTVAGDDVTTTGDVNAANVVATGDVQAASLNSGPLSGFRNAIINGNVIVRQRAETTANSYVADRWFTATAGCGTANTGPDGVGLKRVITIPAAGGFIRQALELDNPNRQSQFAPASTWTARVWATSQPRLRLSFRKTSDDATDQSEILAYTDMTAGRTVDGFTEYTHTITIPDVTANVETNQLKTLAIWFQSDGAAASFTGMSFEPGPVATPFEQRPIGTELALCQRFYQARSTGTVAAADLRPSMRATPTVSGNSYDAEL